MMSLEHKEHDDADNDAHVHDLIIVGAGPCGLALAARLHEDSPSSLFTDSEHQRYHWIRASQHSLRTTPLQRTSRRAHTARDRLLQGPVLSAGGSQAPDSSEHDRGLGRKEIDILVLDAHSDQWMSTWDQRFADLGITHLRSPMFFHADPSDRDGLLSFAYRHGRQEELIEIKNVVGKDLSKHQRKKSVAGGARGGVRQETSYLDERDRPDYWRPSQRLFSDHCKDVVNRYGLGGMVEKSQVLEVQDFRPNCGHERGVFRLQTSTGTKKARMVAFAVSAACPPALPPDSPFRQFSASGSVSHVFDAESRNNRLPEQVLARIAAKKQTNVVVIGGGLTSAQIADAVIQAGITKVYHLMRGPLKIKHFDLDLPWIGKYKNFHMASFWSAGEDEERWEMIKAARNGGSITPDFKKIMLGHIAHGRLELKEYHSVIGAHWDTDRKRWHLETEPSISDLPSIDHVFFATGTQADFKSIPAIQPILRQHDITTVGGLPCLTNDLMWNNHLPLFFTGRLAALRLGPGAANLDGARQGAERVAWKIAELLEQQTPRNEPYVDGEQEPAAINRNFDQCRIGLGMRNQFELLTISNADNGG